MHFVQSDLVHGRMKTVVLDFGFGKMKQQLLLVNMRMKSQILFRRAAT